MALVTFSAAEGCVLLFGYKSEELSSAIREQATMLNSNAIHL